MNEKRNSQAGFYIIIAALLIIIFGMLFYIFNSKEMFSSSNNKNNNGNEQITDDKNNTQTDEDQSNTNEEQNRVVQPLDLTKCLNHPSYTYSNPKSSNAINAISTTIGSDKKSVTLQINWTDFWGTTASVREPQGTQNYQVTGFTKSIKSVFVGGAGQDVTGTIVYYLMEDGTVESTKILKSAAENFAVNIDAQNRFATSGAIDGVSDIAGFYTVDVQADMTGYMSTIAARYDGQFYDLG